MLLHKLILGQAGVVLLALRVRLDRSRWISNPRRTKRAMDKRGQSNRSPKTFLANQKAAKNDSLKKMEEEKEEAICVRCGDRPCSWIVMKRTMEEHANSIY